MSNAPVTGGKAGWRAEIERFLQERLQTKLDKLKPDDPQRDEVIASFVRDVWLEDAARRVQQIQAVTHSLKPIHPDARGTNLYVEPAQLPALAELGSHALGADFAGDVVGNAAALDVYKFLKLQVAGQSLLAALLAEDAAALQALHDDPAQAKALRDAFVSLTAARTGGPSSHGRAKQLYWLTGMTRPTMRSTSYWRRCTPHRWPMQCMARFKSTALAMPTKPPALRAVNANHMAVCFMTTPVWLRKMGGTKPQNISQLNSERGGVNYLLASLPPAWTPSAVRLPVHAVSVFDRLFIARPEVRRTLRALRKFLASEPEPNLATRQRREALPMHCWMSWWHLQVSCSNWHKPAGARTMNASKTWTIWSSFGWIHCVPSCVKKRNLPMTGCIWIGPLKSANPLRAGLTSNSRTNSLSAMWKHANGAKSC